MLIQEVCQRCSLTKKALNYYEEKGLVHPQVLGNGYRDYSESDLATLKEIAVLRQCSISIGDIAEILTSGNKGAMLEKCSYLIGLGMERMSKVRQCLDHLIGNYDIEQEFEYLQETMEETYTIKERIVFAFPGGYGLLLALHFGRFLDITIDTDQKRTAFDAIIRYLDRVELYLTPELSTLLEDLVGQTITTADLERRTNDQMSQVLADPASYLQQNHGEIDKYLAYKMSEEFKTSPAGKLQQALLEFQKQSGYQENFLENIKAISPAYAQYMSQLAEANEQFYDRFPESRSLYE